MSQLPGWKRFVRREQQLPSLRVTVKSFQWNVALIKLFVLSSGRLSSRGCQVESIWRAEMNQSHCFQSKCGTSSLSSKLHVLWENIDKLVLLLWSTIEKKYIWEKLFKEWTNFVHGVRYWLNHFRIYGRGMGGGSWCLFSWTKISSDTLDCQKMYKICTLAPPWGDGDPSFGKSWISPTFCYICCICIHLSIMNC